MKRPISPGRIALDVSVVFGVAGVLITYGVGWLGSRLEAQCQTYCAARAKQGQMVPVYPKTTTGSRDRPTECSCR